LGGQKLFGEVCFGQRLFLVKSFLARFVLNLKREQGDRPGRKNGQDLRAFFGQPSLKIGQRPRKWLKDF
jgi:hypothetical protein